jgi:hypothetical protein
MFHIKIRAAHNAKRPPQCVDIFWFRSEEFFNNNLVLGVDFYTCLAQNCDILSYPIISQLLKFKEYYDRMMQ